MSFITITNKYGHHLKKTMNATVYHGAHDIDFEEHLRPEILQSIDDLIANQNYNLQYWLRHLAR